MKFVCLISTGIDSPVATYLMSRHGEIVIVHAYNHPFVEETDREIFFRISDRLKDLTNRISKLYVVPHGIALSEIKKNVKDNYTCIICKRFMLRYGREIAKRESADAIVTGDSLGQVASQTLENLFAEQYNLNFPVIRPLVGFDKEEIIKISKEIGTYEISIEKNISCKAVPKKPVTKANLDMVLKEESKLDVEKIMKEIFEKAETIDLQSN